MTSRRNAFDLRTKLAFLLVAPIFILIEMPLGVEMLMVLLYISLFLITKHYRWAFIFLIIYGLQIFVYSQISQVNLHPFLLFILSFIAIGMRQMMFSIISGAFLLKTTPINEWTSLLTKLKAPIGMKIGVAVFARFVITVINDFKRIRQALAIRGINFGFRSVITQPIKSFEYLIIPVLMNTSFTARDLTIAGLTKGLNSPKQQTSYRIYSMSGLDYLYTVLLIIGVTGGIIV